MNNAQQKQFFQQCLYTALMRLLGEKSFQDISIGELCKVAGVSRMTYYRSYRCKEEILFQHLEECFAVYWADLKGKETPEFYDAALSFFQFWSGAEKEFLLAIIRSGLASCLMDQFYNYLEQILALVAENRILAPYMKSFLAGGLYKMLIDWIENGADVSSEEMAGLLISLAE